MIAFLGFGLVGCAGTRPSQSVPADSWVGLIYESGSLPGGAEDLGGSLIDTSFAVTHASLAGERFLLLDSLVAHMDVGKPVWKIMDTLRLPEMSESQSLIDFLGWCDMRDDQLDLPLFAIVDYEGQSFFDVEVFRDIRAAWHLSTEASRFVDVDPAEVECVNHNYGYDG